MKVPNLCKLFSKSAYFLKIIQNLSNIVQKIKILKGFFLYFYEVPLVLVLKLN